MPYFGNIPSTGDFPSDYFDGTGAQTLFTLSQVPTTKVGILVFVLGVKQSSLTYDLAGSSLSFTEAPPTGTNNIEVIHLGVRKELSKPASASVGGNEISLASAWDGDHLVLGSYHLWVDSTGDLRIANVSPVSDLDGVVIGSQS